MGVAHRARGPRNPHACSARRSTTRTGRSQDLAPLEQLLADQSPNQRARLTAPNSSFSAANSRDGSWRWAAAAGPLRKFTSTLLTSPVAELGVAHARASVRRRWFPTGDRGRDVVGDDARGRLGEDPGLGDGAGAGADVPERVDALELGPEVGLVDGHPAVDREARRRERVGRPMDRDADEEVVGQRPAARELRRARRRIDARDAVLGQLLDVPRGERVAEHLRDLTGDRDGSLHGKRGGDVHRVADAPLREVLVQQERPFERSRRTLEGLPQHGDEDSPAVELRQRVAQPLGAGDRVVLEAARLQARRRVHVVVGAHGHDEEVRVVGAGVRGDPPRGGLDGSHRLLAELDAVLGDVAVVQPHLVGRLPTEHHLELGEAEDERVVAVQQRDADRVLERLGEPRRQLQATEARAEDQDVLLHGAGTLPQARSPGPALAGARRQLLPLAAGAPGERFMKRAPRARPRARACRSAGRGRRDGADGRLRSIP